MPVPPVLPVPPAPAAGRPAWVALVNDGDAGPLTDAARRPFTLDDLLGEARARLGLPDRGPSDIGGDETLEPLDVLLPALEREAHLTLLGRWLTRRFLLRLLTVRMHLERYAREDPAVRDEPVAAPVVVTGPPRSGTTLLHGLLAQDPALRAPLGWELLWPVPPPAPAAPANGTDDTADEMADDPRIALAEEELRAFAAVRQNLDAIHEYGARNPKECLSAMSFAFRSEEFTARYRVPSYATWLRACDMKPAYAMHRLVLAVLQRRGPRRRWVLKSPVHLHSLERCARDLPGRARRGHPPGAAAGARVRDEPGDRAAARPQRRRRPG